MSMVKKDGVYHVIENGKSVFKGTRTECNRYIAPVEPKPKPKPKATADESEI